VAVSWRLQLVACSLALGPWFVELERLQLGAIDHDPWSKLLPSIAHDLKLSCDGQQLGVGRVFNLYCELFHFFLGSMSFLTRRNISSIASAILFNCFVSILFPFYFYYTSQLWPFWGLKLGA